MHIRHVYLWKLFLINASRQRSPFGARYECFVTSHAKNICACVVNIISIHNIYFFSTFIELIIRFNFKQQLTAITTTTHM